eukprot:m.327220 g.327220  ORF g.327220 m.327220 type:complete len:345 (-) comp19748_c2_seq1:234-1268(-)
MCCCGGTMGSCMRGFAVFLTLVGTLFVLVGMATPGWYVTTFEVDGAEDPAVLRGLWQVAVWDGSGSTLVVSYDEEDDDGRNLDPYCGNANSVSVFTSNTIDFLLRNLDPIDEAGRLAETDATSTDVLATTIFQASVSSVEACKTECEQRTACARGVFTTASGQCTLSDNAGTGSACTGCQSFTVTTGAVSVTPSSVLSQDTVNFSPTRRNDRHDWCDKKEATQGLGTATAILGVIAMLTSICVAQAKRRSTYVFIVLLTLAVITGICASAVFGSWADDQNDGPRAYVELLNLEDSDRHVHYSFALFTTGWILYLFALVFAAFSLCTTQNSASFYEDKARHGTVI